MLGLTSAFSSWNPFMKLSNFQIIQKVRTTHNNNLTQEEKLGKFSQSYQENVCDKFAITFSVNDRYSVTFYKVYQLFMRPLATILFQGADKNHQYPPGVIVTSKATHQFVVLNSSCQLDLYTENGQLQYATNLVAITNQKNEYCNTKIFGVDAKADALYGTVNNASNDSFGAILWTAKIWYFNLNTYRVTLYQIDTHELTEMRCHITETVKYCVGIAGIPRSEGGDAYFFNLSNSQQPAKIITNIPQESPEKGRYWKQVIMSNNGSVCLFSFEKTYCSSDMCNSWVVKNHADFMNNRPKDFWYSIRFEESVDGPLTIVATDDNRIMQLDVYGSETTWVKKESLPSLPSKDGNVTSCVTCPKRVYCITDKGKILGACENPWIIRIIPVGLAAVLVLSALYAFIVSLNMLKHRAIERFDYFISYGWSYQEFADGLYRSITGLFYSKKVFFDKCKLPFGLDICKSFVKALFHSKTIILIITDDILERMTLDKHDNSKIDNVLLEWIIANQIFEARENGNFPVPVIPIFLERNRKRELLERMCKRESLDEFQVVPKETISIANTILRQYNHPQIPSKTTIQDIIKKIPLRLGIKTWELPFHENNTREIANKILQFGV